MGLNCNLAIEFNGLVSKGVSRKIDPFYILFIAQFFSSFFSNFFCCNFKNYERPFVISRLNIDATSCDALFLIYEQNEDSIFLSELWL